MIRKLCLLSDIVNKVYYIEVAMTDRTIQVQLNAAHETIHCGRLTIRFLMTGEHSNGSIAAFEMTVPGAQSVTAPTHSHDRYEESIYGIEGVLVWTVDGKRLEVGPGQMLTIPRGVVHRFDNTTEKDAKALCVITPAVLGPEYFREIAAVAAAAQGGPPDRAKMVEIMLRHGLTPVASSSQA
jgi:quercetin dioxygenase-like cupin family protein